MTKKTTQVRQGEILLEQVASIPADAKKQPGKIVLGKGSHSNHSHEIVANAVLYTTDKGERFVRVKRGGASLVIVGDSSRHNPIKLTAGNYVVVSQREYTPQAIRNVAD
jgi:hypothetical protein